MKIALYSRSILEESCTLNQIPPKSFEYVPGITQESDIVLCTWDSVPLCLSDRCMDGSIKVLWLQETRYLTQSRRVYWKDFDLVLSNQKLLCDEGARYMTLWGTWITNWDEPVKTEDVSFIASGKSDPRAWGYKLRRDLRNALSSSGFIHGYGPLWHNPIPDKIKALAPYRFSVAIENESYPWWHTEKLFDCFATKTVPVYWGCSDTSKLVEEGYDPSGIVFFHSVDEFMSMRSKLTPDLYASLRPAIETNYARTRQLYCAEIVLERILRETVFHDPGYGL